MSRCHRCGEICCRSCRGSLVLVALLLVGCATEGNFTHTHGDAIGQPVISNQMPASAPPERRPAQAAGYYTTASGAAGAPVSTNTPSVTLAWDASPDPSVVGYRIYFGAASEQYTNSVTVGNVGQTVIGNLAKGTTYYFAAVAYDAAGVESDFSNETTYRIPVGARVEQLVVEVYESLDGPKVGEFVWIERYTNSIPGAGQKFLRLRQELLQIE